MNASSTLALITSGFQDFGTAVLAIVGLVLTLGIGYLVFKVGWRKIRGAVK